MDFGWVKMVFCWVKKMQNRIFSTLRGSEKVKESHN